MLYGAFDPKDIDTLPAVVSALFGMFTGRFCSMAGEGSLALGKRSIWPSRTGDYDGWKHYWNLIMPVNKNLWSSSFTCVVSGYSLGMTALFYYLIDVCGYKRWTFVFGLSD